MTVQDFCIKPFRYVISMQAQQRKDLGNKVLDFLRTAPEMTEAYSYSMRPLPPIEEVW